jgi:hypothetical protein
MKPLNTLTVISAVALVVFPAFATTATASPLYGGTDVWTLAAYPAYTPQEPAFSFLMFTSHVNITVTGFVYLTAHNGIGQTVDIVECSLTLAAYTTGSCSDAVMLPEGTYQASIFAVSASGIAISNSTSVTFQGKMNGP